MSDQPLRVGDVIQGFPGGFFGRDGYGPMRVEAIGADWVVARHVDNGQVLTATGIVPEQLIEYRDHDNMEPDYG